MEIISFFIILMLAGFLAATIYLLYRKKDGKSVCIPITESQKVLLSAIRLCMSEYPIYIPDSIPKTRSTMTAT